MRTRVLSVLFVVTGIIGLTGYLVDGTPAANERYYLKNAGGALLFEHDSHIKMKNVTGCSSCHHDMIFADSRQPCSNCHGNDYDAGDFTHDDMKVVGSHGCESCHMIDTSVEAETCRDCHPANQEADNLLIACTECHEDYTPDMLSHDEMQEIHNRDCANCHNARSISTVYHEQCNWCHLNENPKMFADANGDVRCEMCHLK